MAITDPAGSVYMNNMFVTGNTTSTNNQTTTTNTSNTNQMASDFTNILKNMMTMNAMSSIGNFSNSSNNSNSDNSWGNLFGMSALSGMGGLSSLSGLTGLNANSLMGAGTESDNSSMMSALLFMLLASQNNNGQNNNLLNSMVSNSSSNSNGNSTGNNFLNSYNNYNANNTLCRHMLQNSGYTGASSIPSNSWIVSNASLTNSPGQRNASIYRSVIDQFNVENNSRYAVNKQGIGDTYCNIFTWDVTRAMGAEVPHFIETSTGRPVTSGGEGITELDANGVNDWLNKYGQSYGWTKVSAEEAQYYANNGMPAITSWKNSSGHGHLQVVSPSQDGSYNAARGVTIAQAGRQLKNYDYMDTVYGANSLANVEYFAHI